MDVTTCSLDDPEAFPPVGHVCTSDKLSWVKLADGLPCFEEGPPSSRRTHLAPDGTSVAHALRGNRLQPAATILVSFAASEAVRRQPTARALPTPRWRGAPRRRRAGQRAARRPACRMVRGVRASSRSGRGPPTRGD